MEALPLQPHSATLMSFFVVLQCLTCFFEALGYLVFAAVPYRVITFILISYASIS